MIVDNNGRCLEEIGFDSVMFLEGVDAELRVWKGVDEEADD